MMEISINPHPDYKRILGMNDKEYESLVEKTKSSQDSFAIQSYIKKVSKLVERRGRAIVEGRKEMGEMDFESRYGNRLNKIENEIERILIRGKYKGIKLF